MMRTPQLKQLVQARLEDFYRRRLQKLSELKLKQTLSKKNPYLFRAIGMQKASEIVERLLQAYMSSSEETIFGDAFFEPIVKAVGGGVAAGGAGMDIVIETSREYKVISVKSGPNWANSSQVAKLGEDFLKQRNTFANRKIQKQFRALLGHCYGRRNSEPRGGRHIYEVKSGQAFWQEITGDADFYLKLIRLMEEKPLDHRICYEKEWSKAVNRFERDFLNEFSDEAGGINWEKLLHFNSGK